LPQLNTSYKTQAGSDNLPGMQTGVRGQVWRRWPVQMQASDCALVGPGSRAWAKAGACSEREWPPIFPVSLEASHVWYWCYVMLMSARRYKGCWKERYDTCGSRYQPWKLQGCSYMCPSRYRWIEMLRCYPSLFSLLSSLSVARSLTLFWVMVCSLKVARIACDLWITFSWVLTLFVSYLCESKILCFHS
jgi:hypothetical protein